VLQHTCILDDVFAGSSTLTGTWIERPCCIRVRYKKVLTDKLHRSTAHNGGLWREQLVVNNGALFLSCITRLTSLQSLFLACCFMKDKLLSLSSVVASSHSIL